MKLALVLSAAVVVLFSAHAQETVDPAQLLQDADEWLAENIDDSVLDTLGIDRDRTSAFFKEVQKQFQGEYVLDLAALRDTAVQLVPVLDKFEETEPYALWLKSHLDYFEAADRLKQKAPTNATVQARKPTAPMERAVWLDMVDRKPRTPQNPLVPRLKDIFRQEGVPAELVWVAEVESSFNPKARSPVGAAGLFQLMPVTARSLDLSVGFLRDDRLHIEKSAHAAARYLKHLRARFGDWRLALAAYNCGETRVADLLRRKNARSFDDLAQFLPAETQMFVPKVEAVIRRNEAKTLAQL